MLVEDQVTFAQTLMHMMRRQDRALRVQLLEERFALALNGEDGRPGQLVELAPYYDAHRAMPREAPSWLEDWAWLLLPRVPATYELAAPLLRPVISDAVFPRFYRLHQEACGALLPAPAPVFVPLAPGIGTSIAVEGERGFNYVTLQHLAAWGVSIERVLSQALENFSGLCLPLQLPRAGTATAMHVSTEYDAARILLFERWVKESERDGLVALLPNASVVVLARADDEVGLAHMLDLGQHFIGADPSTLMDPMIVNARPLQWTEGRWQVFTPPPSLAADFARLQRHFLQRHYDMQAAQLEQWHARHLRAGRPGVGQVRLLNMRQEPEQLVAVWSTHLPLLLAEADWVLFEIGGEPCYCARWNDAVRVMSACIHSTSYQPTRWRVSGFPSQTQLDAMQAWRVR